MLRPLVGTWFQVQYPPLPGFFPSFSRPTEFAIGHQGVFSLARWSSQIQSGFHVTRPTQVPLGRLHCFHLPDCHRLWLVFPGPFD